MITLLLWYAGIYVVVTLLQACVEVRNALWERIKKCVSQHGIVFLLLKLLSGNSCIYCSRFATPS